MKIFRVLLACFTLLIASTSYANEGSSDCIFDPQAFSDKWIQDHPALKGALWDQSSRSFSFQLGAGEFLYIQGGGCDSYSETYQLILVNRSLENLRNSQWHKVQLMRLAELTLSQDYFAMLKPTLEQQNLLVQAEHYELFIDPDMEGDRGYAVRVDRINNNTVSFSLSWGVE